MTASKLAKLPDLLPPNNSQQTSLQPFDPVLTTREASRATTYSTAALKKWRREGKGPRYIRCGRSVRYRLSDLQSWLEAHVVETSGKRGSAR